MKSQLSLLFALAVSSVLLAQNNQVLMTVNGKPVYKSEFEYIYNKNNSNNDLDKKTLADYVDLFVNFKLKVEEASTQGIDTTVSFRNELRSYRDQLTRQYFTDAAAEEKVRLEAYNRMKEDVDVSHILVLVPDTASQADTLAAWNKINDAYRRLTEGVKVKGKKLPVKESFTTVADNMSEDNRVQQNHGRLGWVNTLQGLPYEFENRAYKMAVGEISKPFKTHIGYHIIQVNGQRPAPAEVLTAHIMIRTVDEEKLSDAKQRTEAKLKNAAAKLKIDSLYQRAIAGDVFGLLAAQFSEDPGSAGQNGELPWFGTGRMVAEVSQAAFALQNIGDISQPVKSDFGWHIIKLLDRKSLGTYAELKDDINNRIMQDERSTVGRNAFINNCKQEFNFVSNAENVNEFVALLQNNKFGSEEYLTEIEKLNKPLFSFADKNYSQADFAKFIKQNTSTYKRIAQEIINEKFVQFTESELTEYYDSQLENKYPDFRNLMNEYHDGILLFEVNNREVWDKASKDIDGLKQYFTQNQKDYVWSKPHYKGRIIWCKDENTLKAAKKLVKNLAPDSIDKFLRSRLNDSIQYVKIEKNLYVEGDNKVIDKLGFKVKNVNYDVTAEYPYVFVFGKILKDKPEDYSDVRGPVTADYQEYLEQEWVKTLRQKYAVVINNEILKTVKEN
ncbi:MAG: peptidylprolyl isomerase [Paludibacter sp.]|jgi:peptidyl-prolyl cis-trans isomerase SurA|nr:peptidylprolyl isomerase [Paludibacter sp.]